MELHTDVLIIYLMNVFQPHVRETSEDERFDRSEAIRDKSRNGQAG